MKHVSWFCTAALLVATSAAAIDDRFNPANYEKGGFAPVADASYTKECGGCHFVYLPGTLPARSWKKLMAGADQHFGESLALTPEVARQLEDYLTANAADRSDFRGSEAILYRLSSNVTPLRATDLPVMRQRHYIVEHMLVRNPAAKVKKLTNCNECHEKAETGSFAYREIVVPGISKVVRPGSLF